MSLDYDFARAELNRLFDQAEENVASGNRINVGEIAEQAASAIFQSNSMSIREALLGCSIAKLLDTSIDVTMPYVNHGANSFNGRTLDEKVVNPLLKSRQVPSSKGPYLAMFRRSVKFDETTQSGTRDRGAFQAMLNYLNLINLADDPSNAESYVLHLLEYFVILRDDSRITLARINRLSLPQLKHLISELLESRSGGRYPVLLSTAMLLTMKRIFHLSWEINIQGINTSDSSTNSGGDIDVTDSETGNFVFSIEITERIIDRNRVVSTFSSKISPRSIDDYLFFYSTSIPNQDAYFVAKQYFAQGHDISFLNVEDWIINSLATVGPSGRSIFTQEIIGLLDQQEIPSDMKVKWNNMVNGIHDMEI